MKFANLPDLTFEIREALVEALSGIDGVYTQTGFSNQSCSAYVEVNVESEDGDIETFKVRFSDHPDFHGSDVTFRVDAIANEIADEDGDFECFEIEDGDYNDLLSRAVEASKEFIAKAKAEFEAV